MLFYRVIYLFPEVDSPTKKINEQSATNKQSGIKEKRKGESTFSKKAIPFRENTFKLYIILAHRNQYMRRRNVRGENQIFNGISKLEVLSTLL